MSEEFLVLSICIKNLGKWSTSIKSKTSAFLFLFLFFLRRKLQVFFFFFMRGTLTLQSVSPNYLRRSTYRQLEKAVLKPKQCKKNNSIL